MNIITRGAEELAVRPEAPDDEPGVGRVLTSAFPTEAEATLVAGLRKSASPIVSLVAEEAGMVVGYIMFSPVRFPAAAGLQIMGLTPMAVVPERQKQGIGSALVRHGLEHCRRLGTGAVVVLGHAEYYPRFGFVAATTKGIRSQYDVPQEAFMVLELTSGCLDGRRGTVKYHPAFAGLE